MKEFDDHTVASHWSLLQKFWKDVETETKSARAKFTAPGCHLERDINDRAFWLNVIMEEVGKLSRTINKLSLNPADERIKEQWEREGYHRILTCVSLLRRLAENWHKLPNK